MKIQQFCSQKGINVKDVTENMIYESSSLAVAMEYLGMLTSETNKLYARNRDGVSLLYFDDDIKETAFLSVREILNLLPE